MKYFKLGTRWGAGAPSFYNEIRENNIVICNHKYILEANTIVLVTDGFSGIALATVQSKAEPITNRPHLEPKLADKIDFEDWVYVADAEYHQINEELNITYEVQRGMCYISDRNVIDSINIYLGIPRSSSLPAMNPTRLPPPP